MYHLGRDPAGTLAGSTDRARPAGPRPHLGLPDEGPTAEPSAEAVLAEINGSGRRTARRCPRTGAAGRRVDPVRLLDLLRRVRRRRQPGRPPQARTPRGLDRRASGRGPGRPTGAPLQPGVGGPGREARGASARPACGGTGPPGTTGRDVGRHDVPDFQATKSPHYRPPEGARRGRRDLRRPTRSSCRATARAGCTPRPGWSTGRCPPTTSRRTRPCRTCCYGQQHNPVRQAVLARPATATSRRGAEPGSRRLPVRRDDLPAHRALHRRAG